MTASEGAVIEAAQDFGWDGDLLLEVAHVRKTYPGVVALDNASLRVRRGTVHAVMGENGAGKSTLMKIIAGVSQPDSGAIRLRGKEIRIATPLDALERGIAMIHQELALMPSMTVAENVWIRREPLTRFGLVDHREMNRRTSALFERLGIDIDPASEVRDHSVANRQMIEIAKAISYDTDILIMDEPTSALTNREVEHLFRIIGDLKAEGKGIVYITHKMNELATIADEVSIFRDGSYIATHKANAVSRDQIIAAMVGREITQMFPKEDVALGEVILSVSALAVEGVFRDVSFELRRGEILGFAGLVGSGRTNVAEAIFGVVPATSGEIRLDGVPIRISSPRDAMKAGMAFLTEDRKDSGCFLSLSVLENMQMAVLNDRHVTAGFVRQNQVDVECGDMKTAMRVKTPDLHERIGNLSGGNQQKVLIGRWLLTNPRVLILDEPTRGIDVGAKAEIHRLISRLAATGVAVIMISSELPEVLGMSDRIAVMHAGRLTGILDRAEADQISVMQLASA